MVNLGIYWTPWIRAVFVNKLDLNPMPSSFLNNKGQLEVNLGRVTTGSIVARFISC